MRIALEEDAKQRKSATEKSARAHAHTHTPEDEKKQIQDTNTKPSSLAHETHYHGWKESNFAAAALRITTSQLVAYTAEDPISFSVSFSLCSSYPTLHFFFRAVAFLFFF